eukprot:scaffold6142_cov51-Prasinocladus_malaysianus.AAC.1
MGNFCSLPRADEGPSSGGVLNLDSARQAAAAPSNHTQPQASHAPQQQQPQQATTGDAARTPTAAQVSDETQACTGSKLEQLAVEYLSKEVRLPCRDVGSDRAVHGRAPATGGASQGTVVEDVEEAVEETPIRWQQGELIGAGAFGRVYLGLNLDTGQLMAVKQVSVAKDETNMAQVAEHVRSLEVRASLLTAPAQAQACHSSY